jgi:integrase
MAGVDIEAALAEARAAGQREYPPLREVLGPFLDDQVALGNMRAATAAAYKGCLSRWVGLGPKAPGDRPRLGDVPWNLVTREEIGAVLLEIRKAKKSFTTIQQTRCPLARFYDWQIGVEHWNGVSPAANLKLFIGKRPKKKKGDYQWFRREEMPQLLEACQARYPEASKAAVPVAARDATLLCDLDARGRR